MITIFDIGETIFHYKPGCVVKWGEFRFPDQKVLVENNSRQHRGDHCPGTSSQCSCKHFNPNLQAFFKRLPYPNEKTMAARTPNPAPRAALIIPNHVQNPDLVLQQHIMFPLNKMEGIWANDFKHSNTYSNECTIQYVHMYNIIYKTFIHKSNLLPHSKESRASKEASLEASRKASKQARHFSQVHDRKFASKECPKLEKMKRYFPKHESIHSI